MPTTQTRESLRKELIFRLLDAHERSSSFGAPAPWPRDVIVKLDARAFPEAFAPEGRDVLDALRAAALDLESGGLVRAGRHERGPLSGELRELRAGPAEIVRLYEGARPLGYPRLHDSLEQVAARAEGLVADAPDWLRTFLRTASSSLRRADTRVLGYGRERFKREARDIADALHAVAGLASGTITGWERVVSERLFRDSKRLAAIRSVIVQILVRADPRWNGVPPEEAADLLEAYGVRRKPGVIRCAGCGTLDVAGREYRIEDFAPTAYLPDGWAEAWVEALVRHGIDTVTTIENEYPFLSYVDESGGPSALGARREIAVYVAGFPTPALVSALRMLAVRSPTTEFRHWGDADVGGLRIWWYLRSRIERPIRLFRTRDAWIREEAARGGRRMTSDEIATLHRIREDLRMRESESAAADIAEAIGIANALIDTRIKIEQERW